MSGSPSLLTSPRLSDWLELHEDGAVTLRSGKVEIGQGIGTALAQIACETLDLPPERLRLVAGVTDETPDELWTSASISVEVGGAAVRQACAHAHALLRRAAARRLNCAEEALASRGGAFEANGVRVDFGALGEAIDLDVPVDPSFDRLGGERPEGEQRSGERAGRVLLPRRDLPAKLAGAPGAYIQDIALEGMVHARVIHPDRPDDTIASIDLRALESLPGVVGVVRDGDFVALAAEREEEAIAAEAAARDHVEWTAVPLPDSGDVSSFLEAGEIETRSVVREGERVPEPELSLRFTRPFLAHASIGLCTALARPEPDGALTVWSHSQGVYPLRREIARTLGLESASVRVVHRDGAGCYGHNGADDVALDAALVARALGRPARVSWTRRQELCSAPLSSAMRIDISASLEAGRVSGWTHRVRSLTHLTRPGWGEGVSLLSAWRLARPLPRSPLADPAQVPFGGAGDRNAPPLYRFPAVRVDHELVLAQPVRTSALRSLGAFANVFAIESVMDELAERAGACPIAFRRAHLEDERSRRVLDRVAEASRWEARGEGGEGSGWGVGLARYKNSGAWCAIALRVEVEEAVRVGEVHAVVDCGTVVSPDGAANQIEGGIVQAISWTLKEQVRLHPEGLDIGGWDDYPILGFEEVPPIDVAFVPGDGHPPLGVGECTMGPVAAAIGNAVKHAMGVRITDLPILPERILSAIV